MYNIYIYIVAEYAFFAAIFVAPETMYWKTTRNA